MNIAFNYIGVNAICKFSEREIENNPRCKATNFFNFNTNHSNLFNGYTLDKTFDETQQKQIQLIINTTRSLSSSANKETITFFLKDYEIAIKNKEPNNHSILYDVFEKYYNKLNLVKSDPIKPSTEEVELSSPLKEESPLPPDDDEVLSQEEVNPEEVVD